MKSLSKKKHLREVALGLFLLLSVPAQSRQERHDIAVINGQTISQAEFQQALATLGPHGPFIADHQELREKFLQHLVDLELQAQRAKQEGLEQSSLFRLRRAHAERKILADLLQEQWQQVCGEGQALKRYYEEHQELFARRRVKVSQLLLKEKAQAEELHAQVRQNPKQFAALRKRYDPTYDVASREEGMWWEKGAQPLALEKMAFSLPQGAISPQLLTSSAGYHLLKVEAIDYEPKPDYSNVCDEVKRLCMREREESMLVQLRAQAKIELSPTGL